MLNMGEFKIRRDLMAEQRILPWDETRDAVKLMDVALGKADADMVVIHANLLNVYTGELIPDQSIRIADKWIAFVGPDSESSIGSETIVINAENQTVIPGLIDGHTHLAWMCPIHEYLEYIIPGGTTTIVSESLEPYPVGGLTAVRDFLDSLKDQPIKFLATAPAMVSVSPDAAEMPPEDLEWILAQNNVVGLGESYWQAVLQQPDLIMPRLSQALETNKMLEGHSAGASHPKLNAYIACGISSCHEPIQADEVLQRLRLGLHVMAREGSIRRDLEDIVNIKESGADLRRLILATDGIHPIDLLENGYMETVVQKAIDVGFEPITAIQMATLNVAEHFNIDNLVGGIAPGRFADLLIIPDITTIQPNTVISNGRIIFRDRSLTCSPRVHNYSHESRQSIQLPRQFAADDFRLTVENNKKRVVVRAIEMVTDLVTKEIQLELPLAHGTISVQADHDVLKVAAIDRRGGQGKAFVGYLKGFGLNSGAFASSAAWDTSDIIVVGKDNAEMACAVNRIQTLQGGYVLCDNGSIEAEVPLPIWGLTSQQPIPELVKGLSELKKALVSRGVIFPDPMLSIITLTGAAIPFMRICETGYADLKNGRTLGLTID
jgi:adenine deaminase